MRIRPRRRDDWLIFDAPAPRGAGAAWTLLAFNAELPGGAKFALARGLRLRAEIPVVRGSDLDDRAARAASGLALAARLAQGRATAAPPRPGAAGAATALDLAGVCAGAGFEFAEREGGALAVDLAAPGELRTAEVTAGPGGLRLAVALAVESPLAGVRGDALGALLLRACGALRMLRACLDAQGPRFEVSLPPDPSSEEIAQGLGALSLAARCCAREAELVAADERIARAYWERSAELSTLH